MFKKRILTTLTLVLILRYANGQWITQNINNVGSIEFPYKPNYKFSDSLHHYSIFIDSVIYNLQFKEIPSNIKVNKVEEFDTLYESMFAEAIHLSKGKLISRKSFFYDNVKGLEFDFSTHEMPKGLDLISYKIICYRSTLIVLSIATYSSIEYKVLPKRFYFFNSLKLIPQISSPSPRKSIFLISGGLLLIIIAFLWVKKTKLKMAANRSV